MFEWMLLIVAASGIGALARGRGGRPLVHSALTIGAFLAGLGMALPFGPDSAFQFVFPWAGVGLVALFTRFALGAGRPKPDGIWSCPQCKMLNESSYIVCQACQRPWSPA
jgi:hypothetical protein